MRPNDLPPQIKADFGFDPSPDVRSALHDGKLQPGLQNDVARATRPQYRTIWISDVHLGTAGCKAEYLLDFLRHNESETLYLVGDIIDAWQLRRNWYWRQAHNDVIQKILRKARKGTRVIYVPGNHDEPLRDYLGLAFGGIDILDEVVHTTADGRRMLVIHGDLFDGVIRHAKWLAHLGDRAYTVILQLNHYVNHWRTRLGFPYWSLSQYLKHKVKNAVSYISDFEHALTHEAKRRGLDGVICGHIHKAEIREIDGLTYCNDGDWVESLTALVETHTGELKIIEWNRLLGDPDAQAPPESSPESPPEQVRAAELEAA